MNSIVMISNNKATTLSFRHRNGEKKWCRDVKALLKAVPTGRLCDIPGHRIAVIANLQEQKSRHHKADKFLQ